MTDNREGIDEGDRELDRGSRIARRPLLAGASAVGMLSAIAGCTEWATSSEDSSDDDSGDDPPGDITIGSDLVHVGETIDLQAADLPADTDVDVVWHTWDGRWERIQQRDIVGPRYSGREETVDSVTTNGDGTLSYGWELGEDHGGVHTVEIRSADGDVLAEGSVEVEESVELLNDTAALGSSFTLVAHGIGTGPYQSLRQVTWDNGFTGGFTATTTDGRAEVELPAVGPIGEHLIKVGGGSHGGVPYQNWDQAPHDPAFRDSWVVEVTEPDDEPTRWWGDDPTPASPEELIGENVVLGQYGDLQEELDEDTSAELSISPQAGHIETEVTVTGEGFGGGESIQLEWHTQRGNRVTDSGFAPEVLELESVQANSNGAFETTVEIPDDLGNAHPIVASVDEDPIAMDTYIIQPSIVEMDPMEGPQGTDFTIHLKGVGWTEYDNTYTVVYDNRYLGYGCGFNTKGDTQLEMTAAGAPGWHRIDLYPTFYDGEMDAPNMYSKPVMTSPEDHIRGGLPSLHFFFRVTE